MDNVNIHIISHTFENLKINFFFLSFSNLSLTVFLEQKVYIISSIYSECRQCRNHYLWSQFSYISNFSFILYHSCEDTKHGSNIVTTQ